MSDSVRSHRRQPSGLPRSWDFLGKNTEMGCHFLQCMNVKSESEVTQSCLILETHGLQPTRLLRPWDLPGKSTGMGCHCLLQKDLLVCFSRSVMPDSLRPMDCSPPGSSVHEIFQGRLLEWVVISLSRDFPKPGIEPGSPALQADSLLTEL